VARWCWVRSRELCRRARTRDALLLALESPSWHTRPYEGLLFCIPAAGWFLWWLAGKTKSTMTPRTRIVEFSRHWPLFYADHWLIGTTTGG